jgi:hypothetical protein
VLQTIDKLRNTALLAENQTSHVLEYAPGLIFSRALSFEVFNSLEMVDFVNNLKRTSKDPCAFLCPFIH